MNKRLTESIENKYGSYILPFLWLHGESKERVYEEILAIKNSGISEFCAESRPYEEFCCGKWWEDFEFILKTARELNMRVWLLDDKKFPTGYANGYLEKEENRHLRKVMIKERQSEALGPLKKAKILVDGWILENEEIISIIAFKHCDKKEKLDYKSAVDLTPYLKNGIVYWDIPDGVWRICVNIRTQPKCDGENLLDYYIDMLNPDSCKVMIKAVYEPHYEHFKEYFGNTFAGFFSDEPGFHNKQGTYYDKLGLMHENYPYRDDLTSLMAKSAGISEEEIKLYIPALWEDLGEITSLVRTHYMEIVTSLYRENFSFMLGNWCREHGVMYIGHVIEDLNAHMRLGYGSGHYFKALDGQDMAGMDTVLMQNIPGITDCVHRVQLCNEGYATPEFYQYTLPKMASSHSHIQPLKKGRAMCEIFGAYGWAEGLGFMKQMSDIMLSSGINHFVPHAFSCKTDDTDCPPHFYNGGKNVQYPLFKNLMEYMGRTSHILSEGIHKADVAVFYNAEGEWSGGKNELFENVCASLTKKLIDFDIIPLYVLKNAYVKNGKLVVNNEEYNCLIVSQSEILPIDCIECFSKLKKEGLEIIFTNSLPERSSENTDISKLTHNFTVTQTNRLGEYLRKKGIVSVLYEDEEAENLRIYHVKNGNEDIYMFSNEAVNKKIDVYLTLENEGEYIVYDPWSNKYFRDETENGKIHINIEYGNAVIVIFGCEIPQNTEKMSYEVKKQNMRLDFEIFLKNVGDKDFTFFKKTDEYIDISAPENISDFCGEVLYKTQFIKKDGFDVIDFGEVGETLQVWLNGEYLGCRVNKPYKFSIKNAYTDKKNDFEILVRSSMAHKNRDLHSHFLWVPPTGILGEVSECKYEIKY